MELELTKNKKTILIVGAGITGLSIGLKFCKKGYKVIILEKSPFVGGMASSIRDNEGYTMDIGPHYVTLPKKSDVTQEIYEIIGEENIEKLSQGIRRERQAYYQGRFWNEFPSIIELIKKSGIKTWMHFGIDFCITKIRKKIGCFKESTVKNYLISNYGKFLYNKWFIPYYENLYYNKTPSLEFVEKQFPPLNWKKLFANYKKLNSKFKENNTLENEFFNCYFKGGMISLIEGFQNKIKTFGGEIITNANIESIEHKKIKKITYEVNNSKKIINSDIIVYALPLNTTKQWFENNLEEEEKNTLNSIMLFLFIDLPIVYQNWIIDFYDKDIIFWRIAQPTYLSKTIAPKNKSLLSIEIRVSENNSLWKLDDEKIFTRISKDLKKIGIVDLQKIERFKIIKLKNLYPLEPEAPNSQEIKKNIESHNGEFAAGIEIDFGILSSEDKTKKSIPRLGGVFRAISHSKIISDKILEIEGV